MFARRALPTIRTALRARNASTTTSVPQPVSEEIVKLQTKAKGPWGELSVQEKTALYRAAFGESRAELQAGDKDTGKVIIGTAVALVASWFLFKGLNGMSDPVPSTINKEWEAAAEEKKKERNINPIHGSISKNN